LGGPPEFFGFTFMDVNAWIATEENQDRNSFTKGSGAVMVADPDAYDDDAGNGNVLGENKTFNVLMSTPPIDLTGIAAGTVALNFDSSFRPHETLTGLVDVSFDGGANYSNLLILDAANSGGDSSLSRANESLSLPIDNPTGGSMLIRLGMADADNDWWWAVDNVVVTGNPVPEPSSIALAGLAVAGLAVAGRRRRK
jgi:MYXO-CTERM domain-containing protein